MSHPGTSSPLVIAHRGACGYRPEHTLESYRLAIRQGADFIEPDLVATRDGVLVARHENEISGTTDVAQRPEFAHLQVTKTVDGRSMTGWFTEDFTLAELKTLRARERIPHLRPDNTRFDGLYAVPTFAEVLQLAKAHGRHGRPIGVYPETKHPTYFAREGRHADGTPIGTSLGALLVRTLVQEGFTDPACVYIQSFEVENLLELRRAILPAAGVDFPLVQLLGELGSKVPRDIAWHLAAGSDLASVYGDLAQALPHGLGTHVRYAHLASAPALAWMRLHYASAIGPWKGSLFQAGAGEPTLLERALDAGLAVHPYTWRVEEMGDREAAVTEAVRLFGLGVQGGFFDQADVGVAARERYLATRD
jgi:glycerophosphoryl diester phosphodiesterase